MPKSIIYHNPRCSKSRQALVFLQEKGINFKVIEYLKNPPTLNELLALYQALLNNQEVKSAYDMLRVKEPEYKESGLEKNANDNAVLKAIAEYPKLLERPIYVYNDKAAIGRPIDNYS